MATSTLPFNALSPNPTQGFLFRSSTPVSSSRFLLCSARVEPVTRMISHTPSAPSCRLNNNKFSVALLRSSEPGNLSAPMISLLRPSTRSNNFASLRSMATDGESSSSHSSNMNLDNIMDKARTYWNRLPPPVKAFPWNAAVEDFFQIIVDLALTVMKWLASPLLLITSIGEMSYCARERKLALVPVPLVIGFAAAGVLKVTAEELHPLLKDTYVPWHLIAVGILFTILKLPGPYYPYWGKLFIPHFANGGLIRIFWDMYSWYRNPQKNDANVAAWSMEN